MIIKLLFAIGLLIGIFWYINKIKSLPSQEKKKAVYKTIMFGLIGILLLGTITGRMHWLGAAFAALIPLLKIGFTTFTRVAPLWMNSTGGVATFKTEHLHAQVHIQKGLLTGTVIKGLFEGKAIDSLTLDELRELESYYKGRDLKSYYLIRFSLKKGPSPEGQNSSPPTFANPGREEALQILGLTGSPTQEEVKSAHRKLINRVHPDKGGNDFLASRINQARDVLIDK